MLACNLGSNSMNGSVFSTWTVLSFLWIFDCNSFFSPSQPWVGSPELSTTAMLLVLSELLST